ncbi:hypothetical protein BE25_0145 [Staphylococcus phage vB_SepM_BE25]|nr:hypothetical protein BE25_0145 [Staphylococcus phage vB_SepM_BE25]
MITIYIKCPTTIRNLLTYSKGRRLEPSGQGIE